jgi:ectoine hydroxylase-related dioxygenase (phytanoyl-CoA dioxygenase family)
MTNTAQIAPPPDRLSGPLQRTCDLEALRQAFAEDGYLIFRGVVSRERLAHLHTRLLEAFEREKVAGRLFSGGGMISGHLNCFPGEEARFAYEALCEAGIVDIVRSLSPDARRPPNVRCNFNLPGSVIQHYHADRPFTQGFMIANVAVVDTDLANGAMEVMPGTHKRFQRYWRFALQRTYRATARLSLNRGDVLVRTSNLWHRGMPNRTAVARPMLALTWEDGGSAQADPFGYGGGIIEFYPNWYKPTLVGRLRERVSVAAPFTYSAYRFARSLISDKGYSD